MSAGTATPLARPAHAPGFASATLAVAGRTTAKLLRSPQVIGIGIMQSVMFLLMFRYVFGGAISSGPVAYVDFLVPGFIAANVLFSGSATTVAVAEDSAAGFTDRLRSLPVLRVAVIAGRALGDVVLLVVILAVTIAAGLAVGWRPHGSPAALAGAFGLCVVYALAFGGLFQLLGLLAANGQAAQGFAMIVFPFTFVSSAYVPVASMPGWMQAFARNQPVTYMIDAVRSLAIGDRGSATIGHAVGHDIGRSLLWSLAIAALTAPLALRRFGRS